MRIERHLLDETVDVFLVLDLVFLVVPGDLDEAVAIRGPLGGEGVANDGFR